MSIGILTSGGDCPGLNAVIRGAVMKGDKIYEQEFAGIRDGWRGLIVDDVFSLPRRRVRGLSKEGGTILGTSRTHPYNGIDGVGGPDAIRAVMERHGMEGIIAIGGEGTLSGAARLAADGLPVVGVPNTSSSAERPPIAKTSCAKSSSRLYMPLSSSSAVMAKPPVRPRARMVTLYTRSMSFSAQAARVWPPSW